MKEQGAGVLLPGVDPSVGEVVLATLQGNPNANLAQIAVGLVQSAPAPEVAVELMNALIELTLNKAIDGLVWLDTDGMTLLTGIRKVKGRDAMTFGGNVWPIAALTLAEPKSVTINTGDGRKRVWLAVDTMEDVVVRQSEAIALGNAIVETHGGRVIEDRQGPEVLQQAFVEQNMTSRAQKRAEALNAAERLTLEARSKVELRPGHARAAMAEAFPGSMKEGDRVRPENRPGPIFVVENRVNDDWVTIVAEQEGDEGNQEACAWVREDGSPPVRIGADVPPHVGFTDEAAIAHAAHQPGSAEESGGDSPDAA